MIVIREHEWNSVSKIQLFSSPARAPLTSSLLLFLQVSSKGGNFRHKAPVNDDPRLAPYYTDHDQSPGFDQLFAAMYDLILCRIPKMGLIAPNPGRSIADIFEEKIPNYSDIAWEERHLVGPELTAYLQWLIYSAPFQVTGPGRARRRTEVLRHIGSFVQSLMGCQPQEAVEGAGEMVPRASAGDDKGSSQV